MRFRLLRTRSCLRSSLSALIGEEACPPRRNGKSHHQTRQHARIEALDLRSRQACDTGVAPEHIEYRVHRPRSRHRECRWRPRPRRRRGGARTISPKSMIPLTRSMSLGFDQDVLGIEVVVDHLCRQSGKPRQDLILEQVQAVLQQCPLAGVVKTVENRSQLRRVGHVPCDLVVRGGMLEACQCLLHTRHHEADIASLGCGMRGGAQRLAGQERHHPNGPGCRDPGRECGYRARRSAQARCAGPECRDRPGPRAAALANACWWSRATHPGSAPSPARSGHRRASGGGWSPFRPTAIPPLPCSPKCLRASSSIPASERTGDAVCNSAPRPAEGEGSLVLASIALRALARRLGCEFSGRGRLPPSSGHRGEVLRFQVRSFTACCIPPEYGAL